MPACVSHDWIVVLAAHAGAGASTVALAITDALCAIRRQACLIETADPARSGLVSAATVELGCDPTGSWRRGTRGSTTVVRRATERMPDRWPVAGSAGTDVTTVLDLGLATQDILAQVREAGARVVVVFRPTVPGTRRAEHLLAELGDVRGVVAVIGGGRWAGPVAVSLDPRLRALCESGGLATVADDRRLRVTGPTTAPLPKAVAVSGRRLLHLLEAQDGASPEHEGLDREPQRKRSPAWNRAASSLPRGRGHGDGHGLG